MDEAKSDWKFAGSATLESVISSSVRIGSLTGFGVGGQARADGLNSKGDLDVREARELGVCEESHLSLS